MGGGGSPAPEYQPVSQPVGIYGWRKRCLYTFILFLMIVIIMNLALTIWILRVMDFSIDGMGKLRIIPKGVRLEGEAEFLKSLYTQEIKSKEGVPLYIDSSQALRLQARNKNNEVSSCITLEDDKLEAFCESFEVKDKAGKTRFLVTEDEVIVGTDEVIYSGEAKFDGSVETPTLRGPLSEPLLVKSATHSVQVSGLGGVSLQAPAGDVELHSGDDIRLHTDRGSIYLDSSKIFLKDLSVSSPSGGGRSYKDVHQLCMCQNGRIFLSAPSGDCRATQDICGR